MAKMAPLGETQFVFILNGKTPYLFLIFFFLIIRFFLLLFFLFLFLWWVRLRNVGIQVLLFTDSFIPMISPCAVLKLDNGF